MSLFTLDAICYCVAGKPENLLNYFDSITSKNSILAEFRSQILVLNAYATADFPTGDKDIHDKSVMNFVKGLNYLYHTINESTNLDTVEFPTKITRDMIFKKPFSKKVAEEYLESHDTNLFLTDNEQFNRYVLTYLSTLGDQSIRTNTGYYSINLDLLAEKGEVSFSVVSYEKIQKRIMELYPNRDTEDTMRSITAIIDFIFRQIIDDGSNKDFITMTSILNKVDDIIETGDNSIRLFSSFGERYTFNVLNSRNLAASIATARNLLKILKSGEKDVSALSKQLRESTTKIYETRNTNASASRITLDNKLKSENVYNSNSRGELIRDFKAAYETRLVPGDTGLPLGEKDVEEFLGILIDKRRAHQFRNFPNSLTALYVLYGFSKQFSTEAVNRLFHVDFDAYDWYQFSVLFYELFGVMTVIGNMDVINTESLGDTLMVSSEVSEMSEVTTDLKDFCRILARAASDVEMTTAFLDNQLTIRNSRSSN